MMKERITVTIDMELLQWIDRRIEEHLFANRSHGFEYLIAEQKRDDEKRPA